MNRAEYYLLDVFTDTPFAGNQLAVFLEADGLETATMQAVARELNLAETVFLGAARAANHYPMRIFTPTQELDFAGHPTVGTAQLLAELGLASREQTLILQPPVGKLPINFAGNKATFTTARPASISPSTLDTSRAATLLGLQRHQVVGMPVISSCGLAFHLIELDDLAALQNIHISGTEWANTVTPSGAEQVYLYVAESSGGAETVLRSRMFSREHGLCEDPATGSAAAALSGYLATTGDARRWVIHQGVEMGRPSVIETAMANGLVQVGGNAVLVGKGEIYLQD
ncbi:trans-2,3-dihydro-3-hydroxyanthranilate isomerase [Vreelandella songnenensis]|uniref:Trans-2,3-dihydro-3-hydroxyanthranilate isomerase n=1 Tax=Vreelandella songnenensis TaxID=1176243 RepID=A0A2T0V1U7_9GAMM|nr:PhzF family phenazine biosynthesis protein [Halomonas songnenensis]PRY64134.1 trans-2,3-dihydro-3-hydroxyanthranilate isomerase [Halomonas songnenensis]